MERGLGEEGQEAGGGKGGGGNKGGLIEQGETKDN